jgi:hypothetical protein
VNAATLWQLLLAGVVAAGVGLMVLQARLRTLLARAERRSLTALRTAAGHE